MPRTSHAVANASRFPSFTAFGIEPCKLTSEEAAAATPDQRIGSVWLYMVKRAARFIQTLKGQERANYDVEDVLMELYLALRDKDYKWTPERGSYITFAAVIATRALSNIRELSRTVESPRNSSCRMSEYQEELDKGVITERRSKTFGDIKRSAGEYGSTHSFETEERLSEHDRAVAEREDERLTKDAIVWGIMALTPFEARVIGEYGGLWGREPKTLAQIAELTGKSKDAVKRARDSANAKIRHRLLSMGHPAVASDN